VNSSGAAATAHASIDVNNSGAAAPQNNNGTLHDLQLESPPVLFIRKYGRTIDTNDVILAKNGRSSHDPDQLTDMEKDASLVTTHTKIRLLQEAVRQSDL
jgi:hypothetical protein